MNKVRIFFALTIALSLFATGCGKTAATNNPQEITPSPTASSSSDVTIAPTSPTAEELADPLWVDEHPADGTTRSQLTNMWVTNEVAAIRPISVMFPTDQVAQPQYEIGEAGVLYEIMAEGGISRMMGIIEGWHTMEKIGNIRSMREYFVYAAFEWDALMIHHGNIWYADEVLAKADNINGNEYDASVYAFYRSDDRDAPHNSYVTGPGVLEYVNKVGYSLVHTNNFKQGHFTFTTVAAQNSFADYNKVVNATHIDMSPSFKIDKPYFDFNAEDGLYYRFMYDAPHMDAATGKQLTFKNIIVQNTYFEPKPDGKYLSFQMHDTTRDGWYFTNGKGIHITWEKDSDYGATKYYDDNGAEIVLNTGKTMIFVNEDGNSFIYE